MQAHFFSFKIKGIVTSLLIIAAGVLLLLFNAGALPAWLKPIIFSWQMTIVAVGFILLFSPRQSKFVAIAIIFAGVLLLLPKFEIEGVGFIKQNTLALFCILVGMAVFVNVLFGHKRHWEWCKDMWQVNNSQHKYHRFSRGIVVADEDCNSELIDYACVFGSDKRKLDAQVFKGGEINCVFGNFELDMTQTRLAESKNLLEVNTVFGNTILYVPKDWNIKIYKVTRAFGAFVDKRPNAAYRTDAASTLIISGNTVFGGGELRIKEVDIVK
jgi:predicted membrane protein